MEEKKFPRKSKRARSYLYEFFDEIKKKREEGYSYSIIADMIGEKTGKRPSESNLNAFFKREQANREKRKIKTKEVDAIKEIKQEKKEVGTEKVEEVEEEYFTNEMMEALEVLNKKTK